MKNPKKARKLPVVNVSFTTDPLKRFYETLLSIRIDRVRVFLNMLVLAFLMTGMVQAQTALRGGKQTAPTTPTGGSNNECTVRIVNNTGQDMWDLRITVGHQGKIKTSEVNHGPARYKGPAGENKSVHIKFTAKVKQGDPMLVKLTFTSPNDSVFMIPTDSLGSDLMIDKNANSGIGDARNGTPSKPLKVTGGRQSVSIDGSNFPSITVQNTTGQDMCDMKITAAKTAGNAAVKIDSVYVNNQKVYGGPSANSVHVYFPCVANNGTAKITVKFHGSAEVVTYKIVPTNKDSADIVSALVPFDPAKNVPGKINKTITFGDNYKTSKASSAFSNNSGQDICDFIITASKKIKSVKVNGNYWQKDSACTDEKKIHVVCGGNPCLPNGSTFYISITFDGEVGSYTISPTNSANNVILLASFNGATNRFLMPNENSCFGPATGRSGSLVAINESCSPISQLVFTTPDPGITVESASSTLPFTFDTTLQTFNFLNPILPGASADIKFTLNDLLPYSPTDSFPYTTVEFFAPGSLPFDGWLGLNWNVKPATCPSSPSGSIELIPPGPAGSITYLWSDGSTGESLNNLLQGTYTVTVTSGSGCMMKNFLVGAGSPSVNVLKIPVWCAGNQDGSAIAIPDFKSDPVIFQWSNGQTTETASNLPAGVYQVMAMDASGCMAMATANIGMPLPVAVSGTVTNAACAGGNTGSIDVTANGGTGGLYTWKWNNGTTNEDRTALLAKNYTVTATDGYGCSAQATFTVAEPAVINITMTKVTVKCAGGSTGKLTANVTGGTAPYQYAWSNGMTTKTATGLAAGTHTVTVTDASGCSKTKASVLSENPPIMIFVNQVGPDAAMANVAGGVPPYTFVWNTIPVQNTPLATGLLPGQTYTVTVTDSKLCTQAHTFQFGMMRYFGGDRQSLFTLHTYPNPSTDLLNIQLNDAPSGFYSLILSDETGRTVYEGSLTKEDGNLKQVDVSRLANGIYTLKAGRDDSFEMIRVVIFHP